MADASITEQERQLMRSRIQAAIEAAKEKDALTGPDVEKPFKDQAERNLHILRGTYWDHCQRKDILSENHTSRNLMIKSAIVAGGDTEFLLKAREDRFEPGVKAAQGLLNDVWGSGLLDYEASSCQDDTGPFRFGVVELYWKYQREGEEEVIGEPPDELERAEGEIPAEAQPAMVLGQMIAPAPEEGAVNLPGQEFGSPAEAQAAVDEEADLSWLRRPVHDEPVIERFSPTDFFVDPQSVRVDLSDARYVIRRQEVPIEAVKRNPRYENKRKLKPNTLEFHAGAKDEKNPLPDEVGRKYGLVELYHVWQIMDRADQALLHVVFAKDEEKPLLVEETPYDFGQMTTNRFPFMVLPAQITDHEDEWKATPDVTTVRDLQISFDLAWTRFEWLRSHTSSIFVAPQSAFSGEDGKKVKEGIESGVLNVVIEVPAGMVNEVKWVPPPPVDMETYKTLQETPGRIREALGISEYQSAGMPSKQVTLGEAQIASQQGAVRQETFIERYNTFLAGMGYKLLAMLQQHQVRSRGYWYREADGQQAWGQANRDDLLGGQRENGSYGADESYGTDAGGDEEPAQIGVQYVVEVSPTKRQQQNRYAMRQERMGLLEILTKMAQEPDPRLPTRPLVNMAGAVKSVVDTFDIPDHYQIVNPPPTPEEIKAAKEQILEQKNQQAEQQRMQMMMGKQ
jgi:hypothetical protein